MLSPETVHWLILVGQGYLGLGALFAIAYLTGLGGRVNEGVRGSSLWFRLWILPSAVVLWPLLVLHWVRAVARPSDAVNDVTS